MTPAITGLVFAGLTQIPTRATPSLGHHIGRFFGAAAMVTYLLASGLNASDPQPTGHAAATDERAG